MITPLQSTAITAALRRDSLQPGKRAEQACLYTEHTCILLCPLKKYFGMVQTILIRDTFSVLSHSDLSVFQINYETR